MSEKLAFLEIDPVQSNVPPGYVAYSLRQWGHIHSGEIVGVEWDDENSRPIFRFGSTLGIHTGRRPALFPAETSRLIVLQDAPIDPRVLELDAGPVPEKVPETFHEPTP